MIELKKISKYYNNNGVINIGLEDVSITFPNNGIVSIIGPSGSGKTTLLKVLAGITDYDGGEYLIDGKNVLDNSKLFKNFSIITQQNTLFGNLTVYDNLRLVVNNNNCHKIIENTLKKVNLLDKINDYVITLSGGEAQRLALARGILLDSIVYLLDEPTANLDKDNVKIVLDILKELSKDKLVIIVTHDEKELLNYYDKKIVIDNHKVISYDVSNEDYQIKESNDKLEISSKVSLMYKALGLIKKNIITCFFVFILTFLLLIYGLVINRIEYKSMSCDIDSSVIVNNDPDRIIIDNGNNKIVEDEILKDIMKDNLYYFNDYSFDNTFRFNDDFDVNTNSNYYDKYEFIMAYHNSYDYKLIVGQLPKASNEVLMLGDYSSDEDKSYYVYTMVGTSFSLKDSDNNYVITGVASLKDGKRALHYDKSILLFNNQCNDIYDYLLLKEVSLFYTYHLGYKIGLSITDNCSDNEILIPCDYGYFNDCKINLSDYNLTKNNVFMMNKDTFLRIIKSLNCKMSIFVNNGDVSDIANMLSNYNVIVPYRVNHNSSISNHLWSVLLINKICFVIVSVIFVIVSIILRLILFKNSLKNYSKLRMINIKINSINRCYLLSMLIDFIISIFIVCLFFVLYKINGFKYYVLVCLFFMFVPFIDILCLKKNSNKTINSLYYSEVYDDKN